MIGTPKGSPKIGRPKRGRPIGGEESVGGGVVLPGGNIPTYHILGF